MTVDALPTTIAQRPERSRRAVSGRRRRGRDGGHAPPRAARRRCASESRREARCSPAIEAQLSSIGAGGLFAETRSARRPRELTEVHRARPRVGARRVGAAARRRRRRGRSPRTRARDRLHIEDTRTEAGERMVDDWAAVSSGAARGARRDAHRRVQRRARPAQRSRRRSAAPPPASSGTAASQLPDRPYGLARRRRGDPDRAAPRRRVRSASRTARAATVMSVDERAERRARCGPRSRSRARSTYSTQRVRRRCGSPTPSTSTRRRA